MPRNRQCVGITGTTKSSVELLLTEDMRHLGKRGDIIRVKPGYARNYLLPQGLATVATETNKQLVERHIQRLADLQVARLQEMREMASALSKHSVTLEANANQEGHLYGSIVVSDISEALKSAGYAVEPEHVCLEGPLKQLGMYTVKIQFDSEVNAEVKVWVVPVASQ